MSFNIGIVGLPNVGKSTLFKALTKKQVNIANYPFVTIEPNVGIVEVPDERLEPIAAISESKKVVPASIKFIDIAGLVRGASKGEGLGNRFLSHVREVDAIAQVVRIFTDPNITHVSGSINPKSDVEIINYELIFADTETVGRKLDDLKNKIKAGTVPEIQKQIQTLEKIYSALQKGNLASTVELFAEEESFIKQLHLLTMKPFLYVLNVDEKIFREKTYQDALPDNYQPQIVMNAKIESEIAELSPEDAKECLKELEIEQSGLDQLIKEGYRALNLLSFLTTGKVETKAWTVKKGTKALQAAGKIHTDFKKGFICAEVINWRDLLNSGNESAAKEKGLIRLEGKDYEVQDGDIIYFRVSA